MKRKIAIVMCVIIALGLCSCGSKSDKKQDTEETEVGMPNPMVEYETYPKLEEKIDFDYIILPESSGFHCEHIYLIDDSIVDLDYSCKDDATIEACVRTAKGTTDITGYYGAEFKEIKIYESTVQVAEYKGETADEYARLAWWTDGTYVYSVAFERMQDEEMFNSQLEELVIQSTAMNS